MTAFDPFLINNMRKRYISTKAAAKFFSMSERTFENMRKRGIGPDYEIFYTTREHESKQCHIVASHGIPEELKALRPRVYYLPSEIRRWHFHMTKPNVCRNGEKKVLDKVDTTTLKYEMFFRDGEEIFAVRRHLSEMFEHLRNEIENDIADGEYNTQYVYDKIQAVLEGVTVNTIKVTFLNA